jgi:hypothetical protein
MSDLASSNCGLLAGRTAIIWPFWARKVSVTRPIWQSGTGDSLTLHTRDDLRGPQEVAAEALLHLSNHELDQLDWLTFAEHLRPSAPRVHVLTYPPYLEERWPRGDNQVSVARRDHCRPSIP